LPAAMCHRDVINKLNKLQHQEDQLLLLPNCSITPPNLRQLRDVLAHTGAKVTVLRTCVLAQSTRPGSRQAPVLEGSLARLSPPPAQRNTQQRVRAALVLHRNSPGTPMGVVNQQTFEQAIPSLALQRHSSSRPRTTAGGVARPGSVRTRQAHKSGSDTVLPRCSRS
jgi:hypothetical protein